MFSTLSFLRYGHQTADIKPFPRLTSARLFSQEPRKKLFLRQHEASLKIFEDNACKIPIKSSFFADFVSLVKTLFISASSLSHGDKAWPIFALGGLAIWPRGISKKRTVETGTLFVAEIEQNISKRVYKLTPPLVSWPSTTTQSFTTTVPLLFSLSQPQLWTH